MSEVPKIKVLDAINPSNSGTGAELLIAPNLGDSVSRHAPLNPDRWESFLGSETGSLEELEAAKQLAMSYLLMTSAKVVESSEKGHPVWADRFTQAATELYGAPEKQEATSLLRSEYAFLSQLEKNDNVSKDPLQFLLNTYREILQSAGESIEEETSTEIQKQAIREYGEALIERYKPLFELIDTSEKTEYAPTDIAELFNNALEWLKANDGEDWESWAIVFNDSTMLSVDAIGRKIKIASRRESASPKDVRALLAHELLVHALRGKNGYKAGDDRLATGLPGYLDAEEGLGILVEEAVNGELPEKAVDRYLDIALALGTINGKQLTRQELFKISYARHLVREQSKGALSQDEITKLQKKVWGHIDRIYRGGKGSSKDTRQSIFSKDIAYYVGYKQMAGYITEQLALGKSASEVLDYLSQGKFDPTNADHVQFLLAR